MPKITTNKEFIRDGRAPIPSNPLVSRIMSSNKGKDTKPELFLRQVLWSEGIRGYRRHWRKAPGRPDICFPSKGVAIFVNGCFWHRCPHCNLPLPKTNTEFWLSKFQRNTLRDRAIIDNLKSLGWSVLVLWECEIKTDIETCVERIKVIVDA